MADEVNLTIDGRQITVPKGTLVIEAAKKLGIEIPIFCYHPKMEPVGACRQCLVEIEGFPKPQVSCSTRVADGMVVRTNTPEVKQMWEIVLEFLLINHPLDCPVCDRGGECPLQDNTFRYGPPDSRFEHEKRHFEKPVALSSLVVLDRERCILCFRCVRFQREIADQPDIQVFNRGYGDYIGIFPGRPFDSNFSGNTIELCPVGALLSSVFRFRARPWEMTSTESICPNCGVGCNIRVNARNFRRVVRYLSRDNPEVDGGWLCDRGRFDSTFINDPERLTKPLVRRNGELREATWEEALEAAVDGMKAAGLRAAGIGSANRTNEQNYLFQKFMRLVIGTNNIDYTMEPMAPGGTDALVAGLTSGFFSGSIRDVASSDVIVSFGSDISQELPVLDLWIKKAVRKNGSKLIFAYPLRAELAKYASSFLPYSYGKEAGFAAGLAAAFVGKAPEQAGGLSGDEIESAAKILSEAKIVALLVSRSVIESAPDGMETYRALESLVGTLEARGARVQVMLLVDGANTQGGMDVGLLPGYYPGYRKIDESSCSEIAELWGAEPPPEPGLTGWDVVREARNGGVLALWVMGQDPARDLVRAKEIAEALGKLDFLVVQDYFLTETARMANVVLPSCTFAETKGTFTNTERRVQRINQAIYPMSDSDSDTDIILKAAFTAGAQFEYGRIESIFEEIARVVPQYGGLTFDSIGPFGRQWEVRR
ncbi:MAG: NADH-quinone oxidoreductase subunit NuoG [Armatimonadetes bacterium]|nr:NADH-quinone oxidoreductase subunit NuoG [Armatimonadota bacterium]